MCYNTDTVKERNRVKVMTEYCYECEYAYQCGDDFYCDYMEDGDYGDCPMMDE